MKPMGVGWFATALWLAGLPTLAATPALASAQVVRGRLVEAGQGNAVGGAMAVLEDRSGRGRAQALTRTGTGLFQLDAPDPGEYRVRADRIGYATTYSEWFRLSSGDTVSLRIEAPVEAVSLEGVVAEADRRCRVRPAEAMAVGRVWEEARKALAAAAWTQSRGMYDYELLDFVRQLDQRGRKVESEDRAIAQGPAKAPYVSRPADSLTAHGYARVTGDGVLVLGARRRSPAGRLVPGHALLPPRGRGATTPRGWWASPSSPFPTGPSRRSPGRCGWTRPPRGCSGWRTATSGWASLPR